ncbi:hypothetical protein ACH5RR_016748 [Cinchona calisaya]|uniref:Uncharacterized protein n=1 Tax=Cinchona calisaya TaxID=153742 RepID=A0ABD2ZWX2_9GENT
MAENKLDEAEFWLPSEFLTEEDIIMDNKLDNVSNSLVRLCFPSEFPYDYGSSVLNSPVESVGGSTETESDEDDLLLTELTRQLSLHRTQNLTKPPHHTHEKAKMLSGSPKSTLTQIGSWSGRSTMSSNGSPNGPSQVSSPPTTPLGVNNDAWDLIFRAAGEVARLRMNSYSGDGPTRNPGLLGPTRRLPIPPPQLRNNGWNCNSQDVLQNMGGRIAWQRQQVQHRNQQQYGEMGLRGGVYSGCGYGYGFGCGSGGGSNGGLKSGRTGTGVFLPRRYDNNNSCRTSEFRTKPGCSPAWLPNKVSQTSNKNFSDIPAIVQPKSRYNGGFIRDYDALVARRNALLAQQGRSSFPEGSNSHEICLPQEWTY